MIVTKDAADRRGHIRPDILLHELAHASGNSDRERIYSWGGDIHRSLTQEAAISELSETWVATSLLTACTILDDRLNRLRAAVFWKGVGHYAAKLIDVWVDIRPEGPEHGEGYNYSLFYPKQMSALYNQAVQNGRILTAVKYYQALVGVLKKMTTPADFFGNIKKHVHGSVCVLGEIKDKYGPGFWKTDSVLINARKWLENLGDAFHIAQDRGAHGEGALGEGHSCRWKRSRAGAALDRRLGRTARIQCEPELDEEPSMMRKEYNPDSRDDNPHGWQVARDLSFKVVRKFVEDAKYERGHLYDLFRTIAGGYVIWGMPHMPPDIFEPCERSVLEGNMQAFELGGGLSEAQKREIDQSPEHQQYLRLRE